LAKPPSKEGRTRSKEERESPGEIPPGTPDPGSIVSERSFVSPKGKRYTIITTNEMDPYDEPAKPEDDEKKR